MCVLLFSQQFVRFLCETLKFTGPKRQGRRNWKFAKRPAFPLLLQHIFLHAGLEYRSLLWTHLCLGPNGATPGGGSVVASSPKGTEADFGWNHRELPDSPPGSEHGPPRRRPAWDECQGQPTTASARMGSGKSRTPPSTVGRELPPGWPPRTTQNFAYGGRGKSVLGPRPTAPR